VADDKKEAEKEKKKLARAGDASQLAREFTAAYRSFGNTFHKNAKKRRLKRLVGVGGARRPDGWAV
jgi:hypothetical protein